MTGQQPTIPTGVRSPESVAGFVGVHVGRSPAFPLPTLFPPSNYVAAQLVEHLLSGALQRGGQVPLVGKLGCTGELNDCLLLAEFADPTSAAEIIVRELCASPVRAMFKVALRESGHWREIFPGQGECLDALFDTARHEAAFANFKASISDYLAQCEALVEHSRPLAGKVEGAARRELETSLAESEANVRAARRLLANDSDPTGNFQP